MYITTKADIEMPDEITVRAHYRRYKCGTVVQYDDNYRYANTDTDTEQERYHDIQNGLFQHMSFNRV